MKSQSWYVRADAWCAARPWLGPCVLLSSVVAVGIECVYLCASHGWRAVARALGLLLLASLLAAAPSQAQPTNQFPLTPWEGVEPQAGLVECGLFLAAAGAVFSGGIYVWSQVKRSCSIARSNRVYWSNYNATNLLREISWVVPHHFLSAVWGLPDGSELALETSTNGIEWQPIIVYSAAELAADTMPPRGVAVPAGAMRLFRARSGPRASE